MSMRREQSRGFTLVEILIVVMIIAILAAIIIPQFSSAADETRDNSIKMDLHRIRQQLEVYKQQHNGAWPALTNIADQLTKASKADGSTAAVGTAGYGFGPYLREIPKNPRTGTNAVDDDAVGSSAWYYNETTGDFRANDSAETRAY